MKFEALKSVVACQRNRIAVAVATEISTGNQAVFTESDWSGDLDISDAEVSELRHALTTGASGIHRFQEREVFVHALLPPPIMHIVGAGHISQILAPMAILAGYDVTVIDPRTAFATEERFPDIALAPVWPTELFEENPPDGSTAVVTLVHDEKIDDPALVAALNSPAFYIGALGSRRTHEKRLARLKEMGFGPEALRRIDAPIGVNIYGRLPSEIAVSILAAVVKARNADRAAP